MREETDHEGATRGVSGDFLLLCILTVGVVAKLDTMP